MNGRNRNVVIVVRLALGFLALVGLASVLLLHTFDDGLLQPLYKDDGTFALARSESYYNTAVFWIGIVVWAAGSLLLVMMFFGDLVMLVRKEAVLDARILPLRLPGMSSKESGARLFAVTAVPLGFGVRFVLYLFFYWIGLTALDIHGLVSNGSSLVRIDSITAFSHTSQYWLTSFYNNVSFVGEFTTLSIRSPADALFVIANVVARFFAVFVAINLAFLKMSAAASNASTPALNGAERKVG